MERDALLATIEVVGLGPGGEASLPVGTEQALRSGRPVYVRTYVHPVMEQLLSRGLQAVSFDDLYERGERFEDVYDEMARRLLDAAAREGDIVYAVPGHPLMAEQSVQNLLQRAPEAGIDVRIGPGQSFLDSVCSVLHIDPVEGLHILDGTRLDASALHPLLHTLIVQVFNRAVASDVKLTLMEVFPDDADVVVVRAAGVPGLERVERVPLFELDRMDWIDHLTTVYVPPVEDGQVLAGQPWYVADLVRRLREPDGCPWDRQQTHESLRPYVLEEAYEVAQAIDEGDSDHLAEELGDLWLQVLLHAQIASEAGEFTLRDVHAALASKILRRHPHVFGDVHVDSAAAAEASWRAAKAAERMDAADAGWTSVLADVKWAQPAFEVSLALQERAARVGFDWADVAGVTDKLAEEVEEFRQALRRQVAADGNVSDDASELPAGTASWTASRLDRAGQHEVEDELGDLLFTIVNLARWTGVDVERALQRSNRKFFRRFTEMEKFFQRNGQDLNQVSGAELETYWNQIKVEEKTIGDLE
ncbi:MAG: nucleoside triphosphate pyrophosphohydrolase [Alicyclobacillus sp.]|nr:nucleoside triphosphate pyrophosphohydrolase [Alicyclobacillus sp.]